MFVLPIVYDLLAKTDEEKALARDLMCSSVDYIVDNGFTLVDADGKVTTWGRWCVCERRRDCSSWLTSFSHSGTPKT
jgi:hypothetical protein